MTPWLRSLLLLLSAVAIGAAAFLAFGHKPGAGTAQGAAGVDWTLPSPAAVELAAADEVWMSRAPWGAPARSADAEPAPPPAPVPVGVVASGKQLRAVFVVPGGPETRAGAGDALPDGGRVLKVSRFHVSWVDGQGTQHEQELLADPLPQVANP